MQLFSAEDRENIKILHIKTVNIGDFKNCIVIASQQEKNEALTDHILDQIDDNFDYISEHLLNISKYYCDSKLSLEKNTVFYEDDILEKCINRNLTCLMLKFNLSIFYDELCIHNTKTDSMILQNCFLKIFNDFVCENYFYAQQDFSHFNYLIFSNKKFNFSTFLKKFSAEIEKYFNSYKNKSSSRKYCIIDFMKLIKPKKLNVGDTIGFLSVSGYVKDQSELEFSKNYLENLGYKVKISDTSYTKDKYCCADEKKRAKVLNDFFADDEIKAINEQISLDNEFELFNVNNLM